jgi:phosphoribosylaminoimidazole carboxylase PurK protein
MGAYSPAPVVTPAVHARAMREVIMPTLNGMAAGRHPYTGFLYAGLMIAPDGSVDVLEFNCRMGDPETQPIMMRLKSDLVDLVEAAIHGRLKDTEAEWDRRVALGIVMAAAGYPDRRARATPSTACPPGRRRLPRLPRRHRALRGKDVVTAGGRVLCVTALGDNVRAAQMRAYEARRADRVRRHADAARHRPSRHRDADLDSANAGLFPGILKVARFGYDGKGQVRVADRDAARVAFGQLKHEPCVLEQLMPLDYEVSVVLARDAAGRVKCFPTVENSHRHGILDVSIVPARTSGCLAGNAEEIAEGIAQKMDYVGTLAVEFFVVRGQLLVNEMAPRPHNSGHFTIDACVTNQFEQQVRAVTGLPLGDAHAHSAAVMVNLLGDLWFLKDSQHSHEPDWAQLLAVPDLKLHLYGKHHARPGRKMGHFTVIGDDAQKVQESALAARRLIGIRDE